MDKIRLLLIVVSVVLLVIVVVEASFFWPRGTTKPSWLKANAYVIYEQQFVWTGHGQTEYMVWNVTQLDDDLADMHLTSHGANISGGNVSTTVGEVVWTINVVSRRIVSASDSNYVGKKCPFWIQTDAGIGSLVDTIYGASAVSRSESIDVLGRTRDCWVVQYDWPTADMTRWYDRSSGICFKIRVVLHREIEITVTETATETNIELGS